MQHATRFLTMCLIATCLAMSARSARGDERPSAAIAVKAKRADDKVEIQSQKDKTFVLIRSPYGISQAVIERTGKKWPTCLVLKLQLKGLEHLRLSNGKTTLEAAIGVQNGQPAVRLWKDRNEDAPLDANSPYWLKVRVLESNGQPAPTLPLKDGLFELTLPPAFLEDNPSSVTVDWIDFYRG